MDASAHLNVFSDQEMRYINQLKNSSVIDGDFLQQLQFQRLVQNSNSSTCSNISFGLSYVNANNQAAHDQKTKEEVSSWEDHSVSRPRLGQGVVKNLPVSRNCDTKNHIMAERRRREKLSQRFIALSAIVPGLKKTDKASVLGDTIKYLKQMQERVKYLEEEAKHKTIQSMILVKKSQLFSGDVIPSSDTNSLPEVEVKICDKNVLVRIHCEKRKGVVEQVLTELEKIHLTIVNTSVLSFGSSSLNITIVAQMDTQFCKTIKDIVMIMFASVQHDI